MGAIEQVTKRGLKSIDDLSELERRFHGGMVWRSK